MKARPKETDYVKAWSLWSPIQQDYKDDLEQWAEKASLKIRGLESLVELKDQEIKELRELLQYVANKHLCGTWLIKEMKKHGIEYEELNKH